MINIRSLGLVTEADEVLFLRIAIIREIYNGENSQDQFEMELEKALEDSYEIIIIEPSQLGKDTQLWISMGNCLHKTSVLSGLGSIVSGSLESCFLI